ncbi:hypothetical protein LTR27_005655 [Elasticomyces elasticus]|nr:hypothetical protein LTR27_005655 [Elasticomyces elasticus]
MEMVGGRSGLPNTASTDDIMMGYKRLSDTRWACTSVRGEPHQQSTTVIPGKIRRAGLDLTNIRHLTFFAPLGVVIEIQGSLPGVLDIMMGYKRLSGARWACTSVCAEPSERGSKVRLTTRQSPSYGLGMLIANTDTLTETEAGGEESRGVCLAKAFCLYCYITEQC